MGENPWSTKPSVITKDKQSFRKGTYLPGNSSLQTTFT